MSDTPTRKPRPVARPKVPAFARYEGTSAWRKHRRKARAFAWFRAHTAKPKD